METTGNDQSASVRCSKHGRRCGGVFFHTEPNEGAPADYLCLFCWLEAGAPQRLTREQFESLKYAK